MTTIDTTPDALAVEARASAPERARGRGRHVRRPQADRSAVHRRRRLGAARDRPSSASCSASSASTATTRCSTPTPSRSCSSPFRVGLVFGVVAPLLLGAGDRRRPAPGRRPRARLPAPRRSPGSGRGSSGSCSSSSPLANNGGPGGGDADMVDLFLAAHGLMVVGLAAAAVSVATTVLTTRAPGMTMRRVPLFSWSALVASIGLLLLLPVLVGVLIYLFVDHRLAGADAFGGNSASARGSASPSPSRPPTCSPCRPSASSPSWSRSRSAGGCRSAAWCTPASPRRRRRPVRRHPAGRVHELPWSGSGLDLDDFGDKFDDLIVYALFTLLPLLGVLVVLGAGRPRRAPGRRAGRPQRRRPAFVAAFLGVLMILTGMVGGALTPITDLGLVGHRVRGGRPGLRRLRRRARRARRRLLLGAEAGGAAACRRAPRLGLAARLRRHRARVAAVLHRRLRRPAGRRPASTTTTARRRCGTCS